MIGAGAAGLVAGRRLKRAGYDVILLEARDRIGGRVWTRYDLAPHPVELGGEWIHGDKAITWSLMRDYGLHALDEWDWEQNSTYVDDQLLEPGVLLALPQDVELLSSQSDKKALEAWQNTGRPDGPMTDVWGMDAGLPTLFHNYNITVHAAQPEHLGVYGYLEGSRRQDGEGDFFIVEGYSRLMECLAEGQEVRLNTPINRLVWNESGVTAHMQTGETFEAACAVVTLPLGVLQAGDVTFDPVLPAEKQAAINGLGKAKVNKLILRFKEQFWSEQMSCLLTTLDSQMWYRPGWGRENEAPILTGYMGGEAANRFAALGEEGAIQEGLRQLEQMFGVRDLQSQVETAYFMTWATDPYSKLCYSYVPVGGAGQRDKLAAPVERVLFFAGEATSRECSGTVHGALESGFRAADEVIG